MVEWTDLLTLFADAEGLPWSMLTDVVRLAAIGAKDALRLTTGHVAPALLSLFFHEPMGRVPTS